ncbi:class V aminotransferase [Bosea vaviloviae]|uniref:Class V aminotransferase n=2 Tax=Bosea vaviloviae TaxID=1526658 RepID=A0A1D7U5S5_9HYPH|nr:class V aminotransferase [Bosea vaviloviae]
MALDIAVLRAETPGCGHGIHFNHSGASLPTMATLDAIIGHLHDEARLGAMEAAALIQDRIEATRADAAALLGAKPSEIACTSSASAGFGMVFAALPPLRPADRILVGRQEWGGNLATMRAAADRAGATVETIPCRDDGGVDPEALGAMIDARVKLISLTWLPANGGLINDAVAIGRVARAAGVPYFVDAGQAYGQIPVDVAAIGCDMMKGTGRKFLRGPRGVAILYVRSDFLHKLTPAYLDVLSAPWSDGGPKPRSDARLFETSEAPVALLLGMGAALRQARTLGIAPIRRRIDALASNLRRQLADIPSVTIQDLGAERSGLVSFTLAEVGAHEVRRRLAARQIAVGANGVAYTPIDMSARDLTEIVRASISYFNTEAEIDRLVEVTRAIAKEG